MIYYCVPFTYWPKNTPNVIFPSKITPQLTELSVVPFLMCCHNVIGTRGHLVNINYNPPPNIDPRYFSDQPIVKILYFYLPIPFRRRPTKFKKNSPQIRHFIGMEKPKTGFLTPINNHEPKLVTTMEQWQWNSHERGRSKTIWVQNGRRNLVLDKSLFFSLDSSILFSM